MKKEIGGCGELACVFRSEKIYASLYHHLAYSSSNAKGRVQKESRAGRLRALILESSCKFTDLRINHNDDHTSAFLCCFSFCLQHST